MALFLKELKKQQQDNHYDQSHDEIVTHSTPDNFISLSNHCSGAHSLYTIGYGYYGRLGNGISGHYHLTTPYKIQCFENTNILSVKMSSAHVLVLLATGEMYSFGKCHFGQLGLGYEWMDAFTPQLIPLKVSIKVISTGLHHSLAIDQEGRAYSWGCGFSGALGHGDEKTRTTPIQITNLPGHCVDIVGGEAHTLALVLVQSSHDNVACQVVYSWGKGAQGQLGHGDFTNQLLPQEILYFQHMHIHSLVARHDFSGALVYAEPDNLNPSSLKLYTWGSNSQGQLGHSHEHASFLISSQELAALNDNRILNKSPGTSIPFCLERRWRMISCGGQHCLGIDSENNILAWGYGPAFGLFENHSRLCLTTPQLLPHPHHNLESDDKTMTEGCEGSEGIEAIEAKKTPIVTVVSCGTRHSLLSLCNGETFSLGVNENGQLGTGDCESRARWAIVNTVLDDQRHICLDSAGGTNSSALILIKE